VGNRKNSRKTGAVGNVVQPPSISSTRIETLKSARIAGSTGSRLWIRPRCAAGFSSGHIRADASSGDDLRALIRSSRRRALPQYLAAVARLPKFAKERYGN